MEMENCKNQAGRDGADVKKRWKALMYLKYGTNYGILSAQQTQIPEPPLQRWRLGWRLASIYLETWFAILYWSANIYQIGS